MNNTDHGTRNAVSVEGARHSGPNGIYGRFEVVQGGRARGVQARSDVGENGTLRSNGRLGVTALAAEAQGDGMNRTDRHLFASSLARADSEEE
jgi:hypothetical protein